MKKVKRIEIVIDSLKIGEVTEGFDRIGISGYTVIHGGTGKGGRGIRSGDDLTGVFTNTYVLIACDETEAKKIGEFIQPMLTEFGGLCLVSDALSLDH